MGIHSQIEIKLKGGPTEALIGWTRTSCNSLQAKRKIVDPPNSTKSYY